MGQEKYLNSNHKFLSFESIWLCNFGLKQASAKAVRKFQIRKQQKKIKYEKFSLEQF